MIRPRAALMLIVPLLLQAGTAFDPTKDMALSITRGVLAITVPRGVHLKARLFRVALLSRGTLRLGPLPSATEQDEAGDPIWRGTVRVGLSGRDLETPVRLLITYQPCTEGPDGQCFLPVKRTLLVAPADLETH